MAYKEVSGVSQEVPRSIRRSRVRQTQLEKEFRPAQLEETFVQNTARALQELPEYLRKLKVKREAEEQ